MSISLHTCTYNETFTAVCIAETEGGKDTTTEEDLHGWYKILQK